MGMVYSLGREWSQNFNERLEIMLPELDSYDWENAFGFSVFDREDVIDVISISEGMNDELPWIGIFKLKSGLFGYLEAGCDYTGWECQSGGHSEQDGSLENLISMKMGKDSRRRLGVQIPSDEFLAGPFKS
jgi:hypothetical protein